MHWTKLITEKRYAYMALAILVLLSKGCKCKPTEPAPDPCAGLHPTSADFVIEEGIFSEAPYFLTDTVLTFNTIRFTSKHEADSYEWTLAGDTTKRYGKSFSILFTEPYGRINVTLKVKKKPNTACFPEDSAEATFTKSVVVTDHDNPDLKFQGLFFGYLDGNINDTLTVNFKKFIAPGNMIVLHIKNFNRGCDLPDTIDNRLRLNIPNIHRGYNSIWFGNSGPEQSCEWFRAYGQIDSLGTLNLNYSYYSHDYQTLGKEIHKGTYTAKKK